MSPRSEQFVFYSVLNFMRVTHFWLCLLETHVGHAILFWVITNMVIMWTFYLARSWKWKILFSFSLICSLQSRQSCCWISLTLTQTQTLLAWDSSENSGKTLTFWRYLDSFRPGFGGVSFSVWLPVRFYKTWCTCKANVVSYCFKQTSTYLKEIIWFSYF